MERHLFTNQLRDSIYQYSTTPLAIQEVKKFKGEIKEVG